ncbi:hypothetical protein BH23PAT2_BH23PAT2_07980 [soil metagenome]
MINGASRTRLCRAALATLKTAGVISGLLVFSNIFFGHNPWTGFVTIYYMILLAIFSPLFLGFFYIIDKQMAQMRGLGEKKPTASILTIVKRGLSFWLKTIAFIFLLILLAIFITQSVRL